MNTFLLLLVTLPNTFKLFPLKANQVGKQLIFYSRNTSWTTVSLNKEHDQGKAYENKLFKHIEQLTEIKSFKTTRYHPMGNGILERMNKTVIKMLKTLMENHKLKLERSFQNFKKLAFAYNNTKNKTVGYSTHFLLFFRDSICYKILFVHPSIKFLKDFRIFTIL